MPTRSNLPRAGRRTRRRAVLLASVLGALSTACSGSATRSGPAEQGGPALDAETLDTLEFGSAASEAAHALATGFFAAQATVAPIPSDPPTGPASDTAPGQLALPTRRLLPRTPNPDYYGGEASFEMAVDPVKLNYFTLETWGADASSAWIVLDVEGYEVGWRHDYGATDERLFHDTSGWFPGGFVYRTERLPFHLTRGKTRVRITLRSLGEIHYYASGAYDARQARMAMPTVPLYAAYTHTGAQLVAARQAQGPGPGGTPRSDDADRVAASWKQYYAAEIEKRLAAAASALTPDDLHLLAQAYGTRWTSAYQDPAVVTKVRDGIDAQVTAYAAAPATYVGSHGNESWGGYLGGVGAAVWRLWPQLSGELDVTVDYGGSLGATTRRDGWATALRASVDFGRFNRKTITAQVLYAAWTTYLGNRGLLLVDPARAIQEREALRYLYEAAGLSPWKGDDRPGGGDTPVLGDAPYGPDWFMVTSDGTAKDPCLDGGDYGEVGGEIMRWALDTGDDLLRAQAIRMLRARLALRHPWVDARGVRAMIAVEPIGCRNDYEIGWHVAYLTRASADAVRAGALGADVVGADLVGALQQAKAEGQLLPNPGGASPGYFEQLALPDAYDAFVKLPPAGRKVPMSDGEPDFAWADRENMVVAAKHGDERFWVALDWGCAVAMNRLARVFSLTPTAATLAEVGIDDVQYTPAGRLRAATGSVEGDGALTPPDQPVNANAGQLQPLALRADLAREPPSNRDSGRADAYTLRYGHWLVGLNAHPTNPYTVRTPAGFGSAVDLATGKAYAGPVTIAPRSYVVFYLESATAGAVRSANPLRLTALGSAGGVTLGWDAAPGAATYAVSRAAAGDGTWRVIASGVTGTTAVDASATASTPYRYRVQGVDARGSPSGSSPDAGAAALSSALGDGWADLDVGAVSAAGSAARTAGGFALAASGADLWGAADGFHFAFRPMWGDGTITARVASQQATHPWAKAGVMIRAGLDAGAQRVFMGVTPGHGAHMSWRLAAGGGCAGADSAGFAAPAWVRLVRSGTTFTGFVSSDGSTWTQVGTVAVAMPELVHVGLAAVARTTDGTLGSVELDGVSAPAPP